MAYKTAVELLLIALKTAYGANIWEVGIEHDRACPATRSGDECTCIPDFILRRRA